MRSRPVDRDRGSDEEVVAGRRLNPSRHELGHHGCDVADDRGAVSQRDNGMRRMPAGVGELAGAGDFGKAGATYPRVSSCRDMSLMMEAPHARFTTKLLWLWSGLSSVSEI